MRFILAALLMILPCGPVYAAQESMSIDLAQDHVDITTGFHGASINFYGVKEGEGGLAVVISGPHDKEVVRRKSRVMGIWVNTESVEFEEVPFFYDFALSRPEQKLAAPELLKEQGIGFSALRFSATDKNVDPEKLKMFQDALIRGKQRKKLFPTAPGKIIFLNDHFFKVNFYMPPYVPLGTYKVQAFLIRDGQVQAVKKTRLKVAQIGASATIHDFATRWSFAYGILCVLFALLAGWLSNAIRRVN